MSVTPNIAEIERVVELAMDLPPDQRDQVVREQCGGDPAFEAEVRSLLQYAAQITPGFLEPGMIVTDANAVHDALQDARRAYEGENLGRYQLGRRIASGSMGTVYRAEQIAPMRRTVAVKIMHFGLDRRKHLARFEFERQALAMMDHPHIASVFDSGVTEHGTPFIVMEYVDGLPITDFCARHNLDIRLRLHLLLQTCDAIQHAHQKGVIHRDLKPANILVAARDNAGAVSHVVKVIDFSIAKPTEPDQQRREMTKHGEVLGTLAYMAPEQLEGAHDKVDTRADVYAIAAIMHELLTGEPPFTDGADSAAARRNQPIVAPSAHVRAIEARSDTRTSIAGGYGLSRALRGDLDWIVLKGMEPDPQRRYETVAQLADDLRRYLAREPVSAGPPSAWYRAKRFVSRNRMLVTAVSIISMITILSAVGFTMQSVQVMRARQNELRQSYMVAITAADTAMATGDGATAKRMLASAPKDVPTGWEHRYLSRQADVSVWMLEEASTVRALALSPDGSIMAVGLAGGAVRLHDAATGAPLGDLGRVKGHATELVFARDGSWLACTSSEFALDLWDVSERKPLPVPTLPAPVRGHMAVSPSGDRLALAAVDERVFVIDLSRSVLTDVINRAASQSLAFLPGGSHLAVAGEQGIDICDARTGAELKSIDFEGRRAWRIVAATDGNVVLASDELGTWHVFDAATLEPLASVDAQARTRSLAISPCGRWIAAGMLDGSVHVWDRLNPGEAQRLHGHTEFVSAMSFGAGNMLYSASADQTIRAWRIAAPTSRTLYEAGGPIVHGNTNADGSRILVGEAGGARIITLAADGTMQVSHIDSSTSSIASLAPDGRTTAIIADSRLGFWDESTGELQFMDDFAAKPLRQLAFFAGGTRLATANDEALHVIDVDQRNVIRSQSASFSNLAALACTNSGLIAAGDLRGKLLVWNSTSDLVALEQSMDSPVSSVAFSPDDKLIAVGCYDGTVRIVNARTGDVVHRLSTGKAAVISLAFGPLQHSTAADRLFVGLRSGTIQVWRIDQDDPLLSIRGHDAQVMSIVASSEGLLHSFSFDGVVRVWDGRPLGRFQAAGNRHAN